MPATRTSLRNITRRPDFNAKELAEEIGATVKEGKITEARGKYFLTTDGKRLEIIDDPVILRGVKKLVGRTVPVMVAGRNIIAVGHIHTPWCFFMCYVPVPDLIKRINELTRVATIEQFERGGVITAGLARQLKAKPGFDAILLARDV